MNIKESLFLNSIRENSLFKWSILSALWGCLILISLLWNVNLFRDRIQHLALSEAQSLFQKDMMFRMWAAKHGGVYVQPSEETPPNPYLDVPDRDVVTTTGKKLTLVNPAYMVRQVHELAEKRGVDFFAHITSLNPIRPQNAADEWEARALKQFETGLKEYSSLESINGRSYLRYMGAMLVEKSCLKCHEKQGYKEGDVRGGISVSIPLANFEITEQNHLDSLYLWHVIIFVIGLLGGSVALRRFSAINDARMKAELELMRSDESRSLLTRNQTFMKNSHEGIHVLDERGRVIEANDAFCNHLGYTQDEVLKLSVFDFEAKLSTHELRKNLKTLLTTNAVFESIHRKKSGELVEVEVSISGVELDGKRYLFSLCRDITERKKAEEEIKHLAFYDSLTGLSNRRLMTDRMEHALAQANRSGDFVAICMIDLDGFKQVNDTIGHKCGDQLLIEVAGRLKECIRQTDTASRFGGDEFALILSGFKRISECEQLLNRIIESLAAPYFIDGEIAKVSASIGATIFPNDGGAPDLLLRHADLAMYEAKQSGKNCYRLFNPTQQNQLMANQAMLKKIEKALRDGELFLFYQPQIDCKDGKIVGVEALIRWNHPILGTLPPSEFIPLLEHDDMIISVGEWVIQEALRQIARWKSRGLDLSISVNIAARQLHQSNFADRLKILLAGQELEVINHLEIEILESAALEDIGAVTSAIKKCRSMGIRIALDDFGTGFSSLAHLKQLPVDVLKIDQSFVSSMLVNSGDFAIVCGVIGMASSFGYKVIAEGVESIDHILLLKEKGCVLMQGFALAHPMSPSQLEEWLIKFKPDPLWQLSSSQRPSRSYFEMLLAESSHRPWIDSRIETSCHELEDEISSEILDERRCHFGTWYYGDALTQFGEECWFQSIEPVHQRIHLLAKQICRYKSSENPSKAQAAEAELQQAQAEFEQLLGSLRDAMGSRWLLTEKNNTEVKNDRT